MGTLTYPAGSSSRVEIDDRTLAHVQAVISSKLRSNQGFFFSWADRVDGGGGRSSIWVDSSIPLVFSYAKAQRYELNRAWLELLMASAHSAHGLWLVSEPKPDPIAVKSQFMLLDGPSVARVDDDRVRLSSHA